jgi:hypothetical protein
VPSIKRAGGAQTVEMQRSEDFLQRMCRLKKGGISQTQRLSQKQSEKNKHIKLVVVMSAVD